MSTLAPLTIRDGIRILQALSHLHDAVTELATRVPDAESAPLKRSLENANASIMDLLAAIDARAR